MGKYYLFYFSIAAYGFVLSLFGRISTYASAFLKRNYPFRIFRTLLTFTIVVEFDIFCRIATHRNVKSLRLFIINDIECSSQDDVGTHTLCGFESSIGLGVFKHG